ncbi:MAG TPA: hypothetical protein VFZ00_22075 [Solirubrobacter sp.]|jgi:hypothetical protein|nr:hypothetical protein [Solirubrobacter sp.]
MKLRMILAATAVGAVAAPAALAQTPPIEGGTNVGGFVASSLELTLSQPRATLSKFPRARTYTTRFDVLVTATDDKTQLTIADGDATSGSRLGRMVSGSRRLPQPLQARVGRSAFQSLAQSVDPLLRQWNEAGSRVKSTVQLRQKVTKKASGSYRKLVLVTLSTETP